MRSPTCARRSIWRKAELPQDTEEPEVAEVNLALFPVLVVTLAGDVPERTLLRLARDLKDQLEGLANVLEVDIAGDREELLEVIVDPLLIESYGLRHEDLVAVVERNNRLVAAGALDTGQGRFAVKVPGVFETAQDVLDLPVKAAGDRVVRLGDIGDRAADVQGPGRLRPRGRPTGAGARGQEARRHEYRRDDRAGPQRGRAAAPGMAARGRGRLRAGQVRHDPLDARRPREQRRERGGAGHDRDRRRARGCAPRC